MSHPTSQISDSYPMAALLSVSGGFLDAYTYVSRGKVFANAQTGNFCLLAFALAEGDLPRAGHYLIPILAFILGTLLAEHIHRRVPARILHWRQVVLLLEILLLLTAAVLPAAPLSNTAANLLISCTCALQGQAFRTFLGNSFASTMCTGNLRAASEQLYHAIALGDCAARRKSLEYFGIDLLFIAGVILGAGCTGLWSTRAVLLCVGLLTAAFALMFFQPKTNL